MPNQERDSLAPVLLSGALSAGTTGAATHLLRGPGRAKDFDAVDALWRRQHGQQVASLVKPIIERVEQYPVRSRALDKVLKAVKNRGGVLSSFADSVLSKRNAARANELAVIYEGLPKPAYRPSPTIVVRSKNRVIVLGAAAAAGAAGAALAKTGQVIARKSREKQKTANALPVRKLLGSQFLGDLAGGNVAKYQMMSSAAASEAARLGGDSKAAAAALARRKHTVDVERGLARGEDANLFDRPDSALTPDEVAKRDKLLKKYGPSLWDKLRSGKMSAAGVAAKEQSGKASTFADLASTEAARVAQSRKTAKAGAVVTGVGGAGLYGAHRVGLIGGQKSAEVPAAY
jgi:hypothetical protein